MGIDTKVVALLAAMVFVSAGISAAFGGFARSWPGEINVRVQSEEPSPSPGSLVVHGRATLEVAPDVADIRITLRARSKNSERAHQLLGAKKIALLDSLRESHPTLDERVVAGVGSLAPVQTYKGNREVFSHYDAALTVTITTENLASIESYAKAATTAGVDSLAVSFRSTKLESLKKEVRAKALRVARSKAEQMVGAVDAEIRRVTSIAEEQSGQGWAYNRSTSTKQIIVGQSAAMVQASGESLTLRVTIAYEIE